MKAVSTSEGIAGWWMPSTFEPVSGHEFVLHAGEFGDSPCKITELDPPNHLGFEWDKDWHLTFELKKLEDNRTEFTLIHSGWYTEEVTDFVQPRTAIREHMKGGWKKL